MKGVRKFEGNFILNWLFLQTSFCPKMYRWQMIIECCKMLKLCAQCVEKIRRLLKSVWKWPSDKKCSEQATPHTVTIFLIKWGAVSLDMLQCHKWKEECTWQMIIQSCERRRSRVQCVEKVRCLFKVCGKYHTGRSVGSGDMVAERGVKVCSATIWLVKWGALSPNTSKY